jgi:hypothetical protein
MPISAIDGCCEAHWDEVRQIVKEALSDSDFAVELVSDSNEIGIIQKRIVQNIHDNDIVVCDVSAKNPNVMFELGMRLAFDKPAIIIKDDKTNYSFDTAPIEHLEYPRDLHYHQIQLFKTKLREKVSATYEAAKNPEYTTFLKHFGQFVVAKIDEKKVGKDEYVLAALNELRGEVGALARTVRVRYEPVQENALARMVSSRHISEEDFFFRRLSSASSSTMLDLVNPSSKVFDAMVEEYLESHVPPNVAMKERNRGSTRARFVELAKAVHTQQSGAR